MGKRSRPEKKSRIEPIKRLPPPIADDNPDLPLEVVFAAPVKKNAPQDREISSERSARGDE